MSATNTLKMKRKASSAKTGPRKKIPLQQPSPSPSDLDLEFDDLDDGSNGGADEDAGIYDDPMIDRQDSDDDDSDEDEAEDEDEDDVPTAGPSRSQSNKHLYKAPTLEEMEAIRGAEASGGTTFSLQLSALLQSTLLPTNPAPTLKTLLSTIHSHILSLSALPPVSPLKAVKRIGNSTKIPFVGGEAWDPTKNEVQWKLGWDKPHEIIVGGSWSVVGGYKKGKNEAGNIDLVVVMPSAMFSAKDRMDYRYFHKRSHYLAVIYSELFKMAKKDGSLSGVQISWDQAMGDARRPIIKITVGKDQGLKQKQTIRIHASILPDVFPLSTLSPTKSLLRSDRPTPLYTSSIINDTLHKPHLLHLHRLSQVISSERTVDSFLATWRIWAKRRGIRRERGGSGWFASMLLGWVVDGGETGGAGGVREKVKKVRGVGKGLGHWGALRAAWEFLAQTDFRQTPVFINSISEEPVPHSDLLASFEDVFVDPTGKVNIFAGWEQGDIQALRYHARETLAMLEDESGDLFAETFLRDRKLGVEVYDEYIKVDISSAKLEENPEYASETDLAVHSFADILRRGLSDRASLVQVFPSSTIPKTLDIGIVYNPDHATRVIDIGPSSDTAQSAAAEAFRQLWGDKAELRRFRDGSISESVVWDISRPEEAILIPGKIVKYLLTKHFDIPEENIQCVSSDIEWSRIIQIPESVRKAICIPGSEKQGFRPVLQGYEELYKVLKDIDSELPLAILNVFESSESLRYSSTFVPHPIDLNRLNSSATTSINHIPPIEVVVQFESSPKWPDDLAAIQKVKLALFDKLAKILTERIPKSRSSILFDADYIHNSAVGEISDHASLEILLPQGVSFRLKIYYEKERTLLERILYEDEPVFATSLPRPSKKLAHQALEKHLSLFHHKTNHHQSIKPLHHKYPSYSTATRLLKRWFSSHMLSTHIPVEIIELIMAKVYLDSESLQNPASATAGFVRAIILLSEWDWKATPLFVPIYSVKSSSADEKRIKFPSDQKQDPLKAFESLRSKEKASDSSSSNQHGWVVFTEEDQSGLRWTKSITRVIAGRVGVLAKATLAAVKGGIEIGDLEVRALFITPLEHYDVRLHIAPSATSKYHQNIQANPEEWEAKLKFRNLQSTSSDETRIGFNPIESFVEDLRRIYGDSILWFYDNNGGVVVGGIWNPAKDSARSLKAFLGYSSVPVKSESTLITINKDAILAEISRLGKGIIERVERIR
ncbi:uncharacterized protein I303_106960 [Kwoniella dejecticola CBS 10117]|uniref:U3 small nucleolar RNA-associated protein 22 n=1 Tax=Kwoniella dejecticola CBS 10117 TaxID=1296121 RepID=A0A1A5ZYB5_9TREE|nr:uncharacterized protein I303_06361 [Kwoniella dejecticola CBS 10117]OBR82804.1 hypothetical protein I303_06361 [Kwoniella dejecticola CBS 10117]